MHGYEANLELERRCIRDWAAISRPQVYYSLEKLAAAGFIRKTQSSEPASGPERTVFQTTSAGRAATVDALEAKHWTAQRDHPAFPTWIALSWLARPGVFRKQLQRRRKFVEQELAREKRTLRAILEEVGHSHHEAVWMVTLVIEQFRAEPEMAAQARTRIAASRPSAASGLCTRPASRIKQARSALRAGRFARNAPLPAAWQVSRSCVLLNGSGRCQTAQRGRACKFH